MQRSTTLSPGMWPQPRQTYSPPSRCRKMQRQALNPYTPPTKVEPKLFLFPLRLRHSKSFGSGSHSRAGSDNSFVTTFYHRFHIKKVDFSCFLCKNINLIHMKDPVQYEFLFLFTIKLTWSQSWNFDIPAPAKSSGSLRLWLHNTARLGSKGQDKRKADSLLHPKKVKKNCQCDHKKLKK
jgi:hypothetical protein